MGANVSSCSQDESEIPSCPFLLDPHPYKLPSSEINRVCLNPQVTFLILTIYEGILT